MKKLNTYQKRYLKYLIQQQQKKQMRIRQVPTTTRQQVPVSNSGLGMDSTEADLIINRNNDFIDS